MLFRDIRSEKQRMRIEKDRIVFKLVRHHPGSDRCGSDIALPLGAGNLDSRQGITSTRPSSFPILRVALSAL